MEKGRALATVAVCSAFRPSASKSAMASAPISTDQKMRCQTGASSTPEASMSTTSAPVSAEVTKKISTISTEKKDIAVVQGNCSRKTNSARVLSLRMVWPKSAMPPVRMWKMAVSPKTVIQKKVKPVGTSSMPPRNWRMLRPREMRAMNTPTKGDQAIHQPNRTASSRRSSPSAHRHRG